MQAMILAAGLGARLKPLTESIPKALIKINGFTLLELQIKKLQTQGFKQIIINVHHFADLIQNYLTKNNFFGADIYISDETDLLLETGGGLKNASHFFADGKPFLVQNVDILSGIDLRKLLEFHYVSGNIATLAVSKRNSSRKFLFNDKNILCGWMNKKTGKKILTANPDEDLIAFSFSGIQIIEPAAFKYFPDKDVFSLVEFYLSVSKKEKIGAYINNEDYWMDLGKLENIKLAEKDFEKIRSIYRV